MSQPGALVEHFFRREFGRLVTIDETYPWIFVSRGSSHNSTNDLVIARLI
jgi:hypothetical protein